MLRFLAEDPSTFPLAVSADGATIEDCALERLQPTAVVGHGSAPAAARASGAGSVRWTVGLHNCRLSGFAVDGWDVPPPPAAPSISSCDGRCRAAVWAADGRHVCPVGDRVRLARRMRLAVERYTSWAAATVTFYHSPHPTTSPGSAEKPPPPLATVDRSGIAAQR